LEKRKRLNNYYEIYYQRMSALATTPELKLALQGLKDVHQGMLAQPRVRPSPTPEFSGYAVADAYKHALQEDQGKTQERRKCTSNVSASQKCSWPFRVPARI
jgi:hypothetical protein